MKSWLVMFGFQLSNIIPGFPRAKMYFVPPPYELSVSQACEKGQVSKSSFSPHGKFTLVHVAFSIILQINNSKHSWESKVKLMKLKKTESAGFHTLHICLLSTQIITINAACRAFWIYLWNAAWLTWIENSHNNLSYVHFVISYTLSVQLLYKH